MVKLITVDPGHFHASLVQKSAYPQISSDVYVYAPEGPDVQQHLDRINAYNKRATDPTKWNEIVYKGLIISKKCLLTNQVMSWFCQEITRKKQSILQNQLMQDLISC